MYIERERERKRVIATKSFPKQEGIEGGFATLHINTLLIIISQLYSKIINTNQLVSTRLSKQFLNRISSNIPMST